MSAMASCIKDDQQTTCLLERYFEHFYAMELLLLLPAVVKENCHACRVGSPLHLCHKLSTKEKVLYYFDLLLRKINEDDILYKWYEAVSELENLSPEAISMYQLKIFNDTWRETQMKTLPWKERLCTQLLKLIALERCFKKSVIN